MNGISVIICCYNSESRIKPTLEHLITQQIQPGLNWELILVDNCCTDRTTQVAADLLSTTGKELNWRIVFQPVPGLSFARELGVSESKYDIVLFCDDDNHLNSDYLQRVWQHFKSKPGLGVLGGYATAVYDCSPPDWWHDFSTWYATGPQASESSYLTKNKACVYGAGSAYLKEGILKLNDAGFRSLLSDRKGKSLSSGGDIELGNALVLLGYDVYYDEELKLNHFIPEDRISFSYLSRLVRQGSSMLPVLYAYSLHLKNLQRKQSELKPWYVSAVILIQTFKPLFSFIFDKKPAISKWIILKNHFWILKAYFFSGTTIEDSYAFISKWRTPY